MPSNNKTSKAARGFDRIAPFYDFMEGLMERSASKWRELQWSKVEGRRILEVGVGTGRNFPYYPPGAEITAIDFSEGMLKHARDKAARQGVAVSLHLMDVHSLQFENNSFDTVVASLVFCSVPDPVQGLKEVGRVCRTGGKVVLLEHMRSSNAFLGSFMDLVNPLAVRMMGENINRRTVENVERSDLRVEKVTELWAGIFKLIEARKG